MNCKNCDTILTGKFCATCGRPVQIDRVDWHYIVHEIRHVLHFEKGIAHTVKELLVKPGPSIHEFITVDRSRLVKPVLFIVITSLIYTTIEHFFHIEQGYVNYSDSENLHVSTVYTWMQNHYGYVNILMGIFIAFWLKLLFKKHDYNFFEILIMLCFVMGMGMLIFSFFSIIEGLTGIHLMTVAGIVGVAYCAGAIGHFVDRTRVAGYLKALASYMLGMITFSVFMILLRIVVALIKH